MANGDTQLTPRDAGRSFEFETGTLHVLQMRRLQGHFLEVEDVHFNHDSAVLLADYRDTAAADDDAAADAQDDAADARITALAVLAAAYEHAAAHPGQKLLVAGHTDRSGSDSYNLSLSKKRAENVRHLLRGEKELWVASCKDHHKVEDRQQLLKWMAEDHGWDCDPVKIDNKDGPDTRGATRRFKERYNAEFGAALALNEKFDDDAWRAFFDVYLKELRESMDVSATKLEQLQQSLAFLDDAKPAVGCGENWPVTAAHRSRVDRRVELVFFDAQELPTVPLPCHPSDTRCLKDQCEIRNESLYSLQPVPVVPVLAPRFRLSVHLVLVWKDPAGVDHPFPVGMPARVRFGDGSPPKDVTVEADGALHFLMDKRRGSFTLEFPLAQASYIATAPGDFSGGERERLVARSEVPALLRERWRVFLLPPTLSLASGDWSVDPAAAPTYAKPDFTGLAAQSQIGTHEAPCRVELLPHWQYFKLTYYDRRLHQRLSLPPTLVFEGFADRDQIGGDPDAQSNWTTDPEGCQCLPWLRQTGADGSPQPKPDARVLLRLRCKPDTWVDSRTAGSAATRGLVTRNPGAASNDPGMNEGSNASFDPAVANGRRLGLYDLPPLWKSHGYFARLSATRSGKFEELAADPTTNAAPLTFSLDDLVLCDSNARPIAWTPGLTADTDRVALFHNSFATGTDLSPVGLYKPDDAAQKTYFTQRPSGDTSRNLIVDYPDWTRLVIQGGNLYDAFERRVALEPDGPVGARAAVLVTDLTAAPNYIPVKKNEDRPPLVRGNFVSVQPFYAQRHHAWWRRNNRDGDRDIGRYDMIVVRCCDVGDDGETEVAACLSYFRFCFDFTPSFKAGSSNPNAVGYGLTGAAAQAWINRAITNLLERWHEEPVAIEPPAGSTEKFRARSLWFAQHLPRSIAHFEIGVFKDDTPPDKWVRGSMASDRGEGVLDQTDDKPAASKFFVFAHETGHGGSLHDEYVEKTCRTPILPGFDCFSPGSPYADDGRAMMVGDMDCRARDFWHVAEWLRAIGGNRSDYEVVFGSGAARTRYALPHHPQAPRRSHIAWPLVERLDQERGPHGRFDVYFYPLGADRFATHVLAGGPYQGMVLVLVKMLFKFDAPNGGPLQNFLGQVHTAVRSSLNGKFWAAGRHGGRDYARVAIVVAPRYWIKNSGENLSPDAPGDDDEHIEVKVPNSGTPAWDSGILSDDHELHFPLSSPAQDFVDFFGNMLGIPTGSVDAPASWEPIVRLVLPGASVQRV